MILGITNLVIGCLIIIIHFFSSGNFVTQQTVRYIGYLIGSIFICSGFILIQIDVLKDSLTNNKKNNQSVKKEKKLEEILLKDSSISSNLTTEEMEQLSHRLKDMNEEDRKFISNVFNNYYDEIISEVNILKIKNIEADWLTTTVLKQIEEIVPKINSYKDLDTYKNELKYLKQILD